MEKVTNCLVISMMVSTVTGSVAGAAIYGGRFITQFPKLPLKSALWTATGFGVATFAFGLACNTGMVNVKTQNRGIFFGGLALATLANKTMFGKDLSILSNAATPMISALSLYALGCLVSKRHTRDAKK